MDLEQARATLEKINSLYNSLQRDNGKISSIERDLMLSYIQQLYEAFLHEEASSHSHSAEAPAPRKEDPKPVRRSYTPPRIIEIPDSLKENSQPKPDPTRRPQPQPQPQPPRPEPKPEPQPKPDPRPAPQPDRPEPEPEPEPPQPEPTEQQAATAPSQKIARLFEFKQATELSEKLSERPIQDLTKALAINDRLLYMNELFGRDLNALNDYLSRLNRMDSMEEAKPLLLQLAEQYGWADEEQEDIAREFIRLVRRRYQ